MSPIRSWTNLGRRTRNTTIQINYRSNRTAQEREDERERIRLRQTLEARYSTKNGASFNRAAFCCDMSIDYSAYNCVGVLLLELCTLYSVCQYCNSIILFYWVRNCQVKIFMDEKFEKVTGLEKYDVVVMTLQWRHLPS